MSKHRLKPPSARAHWLIHFLHVQLRLRDMTRSELARQSGLYHKTLEAWWTGEAVPNLMNFEAVLMVLDFELKPTFYEAKAKSTREKFKHHE